VHTHATCDNLDHNIDCRPGPARYVFGAENSVTDFTYVRTCTGFVSVAFAIDLYSRAIVGWHASTVKDPPFVEACLTMAL
jgi:transposase InsO family protein